MEKKIYVYGEDGSFLFETIETEGTIYPDSTEIEPIANNNPEIYFQVFDKVTQKWNLEYHNHFLNLKSTELNMKHEKLLEYLKTHDKTKNYNSTVEKKIIKAEEKAIAAEAEQAAKESAEQITLPQQPSVVFQSTSKSILVP